MCLLESGIPQFRPNAIIFGFSVFLLCSAHAISAQQSKPLSQTPDTSHVGTRTGSSAASLAESETAHMRAEGAKIPRTEKVSPPASQPANPPTVTLKDGKLTVKADNSSLIEILQHLANISGMSINGLEKGPRIFGVYGPGNSRDVLRDILFDSGYNYIMVGGSDENTPQELLLTAQNKDAHGIVPFHRIIMPAADRDEVEPTKIPPVPNALGPGAVAPVPSLDQQDENTRAESTLQRLQHMQNQQQEAPQ